MGRPVKSIGFMCGSFDASSFLSGPTCTTKSLFKIPATSFLWQIGEPAEHLLLNQCLLSLQECAHKHRQFFIVGYGPVLLSRKSFLSFLKSI